MYQIYLTLVKSDSEDYFSFKKYHISIDSHIKCEKIKLKEKTMT